jgi:nitroreductase
MVRNPAGTASALGNFDDIGSEASDLGRMYLIEPHKDKLFNNGYLSYHEGNVMDTFESIATKLDVREFSSEKVSDEIKSKVLEAARMTGTGLNTQHWRFIIVEDPANVKRLAQDSISGNWVAGANFAVIILTNPEHNFHMIDAGRVAQNMQLAAWNFGVASGLFTGMRDKELRRDFNIPKWLNPSIVLGFGYPARKLAGKKNRRPLETLVHRESFRD